MLAYLDSSSASAVTSAVVAGAAGVAVVAKSQWRKVTSPFRKKNDETAPATADSWDTPGSEG
jgi:hypothetical protein